MKLITWNIQWGRGVDGQVDLTRIVRDARSFADFDVLCLQEVARNYPSLPGSIGEDQFRLLAELLPGYTAIEGIVTDTLAVDERRAQFGNMLFSRWPVLRVLRRLLPWPADPALPSMPRIALEALLQTPSGLLRVTTTHLAYYSAKQRVAQVDALRDAHAESCGHAADLYRPDQLGSPFVSLPNTLSSIVCGDFNFQPDELSYQRMQEPISDVPSYLDAWRCKHGARPHDPTCGVHDKAQWGEEAFCCDFIFLSANLRDRVAEVRVDLATKASDHQPVLLELLDFA